jgi:O-antigen/teichoic acid export membrane protein
MVECIEIANQNKAIEGGVARNTILNLVGQIAPMIAALGSIPFIIKGLGTGRFGVLGLVWVVIGYFSFFDLGFGRALTQLLAERLGKRSEDGIPALIWTSLFMMALFSSIGMFALVILAPRIVYYWLNIPKELQGETLQSLYLLSLSVPIIVINSGLRGALEARQSFGVLNIMRIPYGIFTFVSPLFIIPFSQSLFPIVAVAIAGRIVFCLAHLYFCLRAFPSLKSGFIIDRKVILTLFQFSSWMTVTNLIGPLMVYLDRLFIGIIISLSAVAYYTTPFEVVTKLLVISGALVGVLFPAFATSFDQSRQYTAGLFVKGVKYIYLTLFPLVLALVSLGYEGLNLWLGAEYAQNSTRVLQVLAIGVLINGVAQVPFALIQGVGRPDLTAKIHIAELPFYLICLWYFSRTWGINGVAIVWLGRAFVDLLILFAFARRILANHLPSLQDFILIAVLTLFALTLIIFVSGLYIKGVLVLIILAAFVFLAWNLLLTSTEQATIWLYLKRIQSMI